MNYKTDDIVVVAITSNISLMDNEKVNPKYGEMLFYRTENNDIDIGVLFSEEIVWLTQAQMTELFQTTKQNISLYINNIIKEEELEESSVVKEYLTTSSDDKEYKTLQTREYKIDFDKEIEKYLK